VAGIKKIYSKKAINQLINITSAIFVFGKTLRWEYHAKVIKELEIVNNKITIILD
jgi:hypothetical protein